MKQEGTFWIQFLTGRELLKEKQKDYRNTVLLQVFILVFGMSLTSPIIHDPTSNASKLILTLFSFFGVLYTYLLWDMLRNFTRNKTLLIGFFVVFILITTVGVLLEFPYYRFIELSDRRTYLFVIHICLFPIEVTVIAYSIRDIFMGKFLTPDKLWGSACVYLMIGISFGSLYDLICIASPAGLGGQLPLGLPNYVECVNYSFRILGGMDSNYPDAINLIQNISVLESIWSNLFTLLIIGKLLGLPRLEEPQ